MTDDDEEFTRKDVVTLLLEVMDWTYVQATRERPMTEAEQKVLNDIRTALAAPEQEPVAWHYRNNGGASVMHWGPSAKLDADMQAAKDYPNAHKVTPLYTAPPAAAPEPKSKTPAWWMDGLTATLMREGVNKHRAREIAQGYWEAYCQIPGQEEVQP